MDELVLQEYRKALVLYVYRLTGCIEESKDISQEVLIRYIKTKDKILNPKAWLFKVATNLSFDFFKSSRNTKETYIGTWLPEPYVQTHEDSYTLLERDESISTALLTVLQYLNNKERVAYILHDIFEFKHKEIAKLLDTSVENSRQLTSRAKKKLKYKKSSYKASKEEHENLTTSFSNAIKDGDFIALKKLFTKDIELHSDGGGKAIAARKVLYGDNEYISRFLIKITRQLFKKNNPQGHFKTVFFNGEIGVLLSNNNTIQTAYSFEIHENKISRIFAHRNPDKLIFF
jgi:RNA polymerase sigma-70 factor (ECF subfamily)